MILYPFHPLCGVELELISLNYRTLRSATVVDPTGARLRIPKWMLEPEAACCKVWPKALLSPPSLLALAEFLKHVALPGNRGILEQEQGSGKEEAGAAAPTARGRTPRSTRISSRVAGRAGSAHGGSDPNHLSETRRK